MTNPRTPREEQVGGIFDTLSTEQTETMTAARGGTDRQAAIIADLQSKLAGATANSVTDEQLTSWQDMAAALKASADEAQAAFDKIGVPEQPQPPVEDIVASHKRKAGKGKGR